MNFMQADSEAKIDQEGLTQYYDELFNEVVYVDHLFLDQHAVMHIMDSASRYSVGTAVNDTSMAKAILAFDAHGLKPFGAP